MAIIRSFDQVRTDTSDRIGKPVPAVESANTEKEQPGFWEEAWGSFKYSGLQSPANGLAQIADHYAGTNWLPTLHYMEQPKENNSWSGWLGQQLGGAAGVTADFMVLGLAGRAAGNILGLTTAAAETAESVAVGRQIFRSVGTGFAYDTIFKPVDPKEGNFELARLRNGAIGGLTFGTLTGSTALAKFGLTKFADGYLTRLAPSLAGSKVVNGLGLGSAVEKYLAPAVPRLASFLKHDVVAGGLSGIASGLPAGEVSAYANAFLTRGELPTAKEVNESVLGFSVVGGTLGAAHEAAEAISKAGKKSKASLPGDSSKLPATKRIDSSAKRRSQPIDAINSEKSPKGVTGRDKTAESSVERTDTREGSPEGDQSTQIDQSRSKLSNEKTAKDFAAGIVDTLDPHQEDLTQQVSEVAKLRQQRFDNDILTNQFVAGELDVDEFDQRDFANPAHMREVLKNRPDLQIAYEEYLSMDQALRQPELALDAALSPRKDALAKFLDVRADELRIPRVQLEIAPDADLGDAEAQYIAAKGVMRIKESAIANGRDLAQLADSIAHEFTHNDQDSLLIRKYADEVKVGHSRTGDGTTTEPVTQEQIEQIKERYKSGRGWDETHEVSEEYVRKVLNLRNGERLTDAEKQRADVLEESYRDFHERLKAAQADGTDSASVKQQIDEIDLGVEVYSSFKTARGFIEKCCKPFYISETRLFGSGTHPEIEQLKQTVRKIASGELPENAWNEAAARQVIEKIVEARVQRLDELVVRNHEAYLNDPHEIEARAAGGRVGTEVELLKPSAQPSSDHLPTDRATGTQALSLADHVDQPATPRRPRSANEINKETEPSEPTKAGTDADDMPGGSRRGDEALAEALDELAPEVGRQFQGHGIAKGFPYEQLESLRNILRNGRNDERVFYEMPLKGMEQEGGAFGAVRPFDSGGFILLSSPGETLTEGGVKQVLVNEHFYDEIPKLQAEFPQIRFIKASESSAELQRILNEAIEKGYEPKPLPEPVTPEQAEETHKWWDKMQEDLNRRREGVAAGVGKEFAFDSALRLADGSQTSVSLAQELRGRVEKRFGRLDNLDSDIPDLLMEQPELKLKIEEAMVERVLYGDADIDLNSMGFKSEGENSAVINTKLERIFRNQAPELIAKINLANIGLHKAFADQPISDRVMAKVEQVLSYDSEPGRERLQELGMTPQEIDGLLLRARWLNANRRFPGLWIQMERGLDWARQAEQDQLKLQAQQDSAREQLKPESEQSNCELKDPVTGLDLIF